MAKLPSGSGEMVDLSTEERVAAHLASLEHSAPDLSLSQRLTVAQRVAEVEAVEERIAADPQGNPLAFATRLADQQEPWTREEIEAHITRSLRYRWETLLVASETPADAGRDDVLFFAPVPLEGLADPDARLDNEHVVTDAVQVLAIELLRAIWRLERLEMLLVSTGAAFSTLEHAAGTTS